MESLMVSPEKKLPLNWKLAAPAGWLDTLRSGTTTETPPLFSQIELYDA
jgi:hypothetical protein